MAVELEMVDLKFGALPDGPEICVQFEPIGTSFLLSDGDYVILRTPRGVLESMEVRLGPGGLSVWPAYPVEHIVLYRTGTSSRGCDDGKAGENDDRQ